MPRLENDWVSRQAVTYDVSELSDCAVAVEATYYISRFLDYVPEHEPLLTAIGGLTGMHAYIERDLDQWKAHNITPLFVFDGQPIVGQDDRTVEVGLRAKQETDRAWDMYFNHQPENAVTAFSNHNRVFRAQQVYPMLQGILKERGLHFLVPPYNAAAQIAYFDMIDSDQIGAIMGSQELLLYPIHDCVIRSFKWDTNTVTAISKKQLMRTSNMNDSLFVDAVLMLGNSFLPVFPALLDPEMFPSQPATLQDAHNMLRTSGKSVAHACTSFHDMIQANDPQWLDKYQKARMAVDHFVYVDESGEIKVHNFEGLTHDNFEYLGLQLPSELYHYLNTGLIGPRILSWITHCKITVPPTMDGVASTEYKKLVSKQLNPTREQALGLLVPRLNRGIQHRSVSMSVWYDSSFSYTIDLRNVSSPRPAAAWNVSEQTIKSVTSKAAPGSIDYELSALQQPDFVKATLTKEKNRVGLASADAVVSVAIWKFLHLRDYINDSHELTGWGKALATTMSALAPTVAKYADVPGLGETALLAFELIRYDVLNAKNRNEELGGLPLHSTEQDKDSLLLLSRAASLLKLRHESQGYTGPLNKNLLYFHSLASAVRNVDRDLMDAIVASMFLYAQAKRERDDGWQIGHRLPFHLETHVGMGIAVKTLLDDLPLNQKPQERKEHLEQFVANFVPMATHFDDDLAIAFALFDALYAGVQTLGDKEMTAADKTVWARTAEYLAARR